MSIVAQNVRRILTEKGFKQCAIAEKSGIPPRSLSDMLNERRVIRAETIPLLAKALEVEPTELFRQ